MYTSYALQYTSVDVPTVLGSGVDLFITEGGTGPAFTGAALTPTDLATLQTGGTSVLAYVNVAVTDDNRDYWDPAWTDDGTDTGTVLGTAPAWLQAQPSNSFGYIVDYSDPAWQAIVIQQAVALVTAGYDGVFLDDVAQYYVSGATGLTIAQQADVMMDLVTAVSSAITAVNPSAQVVVNSTPYIVTDSATGSSGISALTFLSAIDGMLLESYYGINGSQEAAIAQAQTYIAPYTQVLALEYGGTDYQNWAFYGTAMADGFLPFAAGDASYSGFGTVTGPTPGDDNVIGLNISQSVYLMAGNDSLVTGVGNDTIMGHAGNDTVRAGSGDDLVMGGWGADSLYGDDGNDTLHGNEDADYIYGGDGLDVIRGGIGNDTVYGQNGDDVILLDEDNDYADGGYGHDTIFGGLGDDSIRGNYNNDLIFGEDGNDTISGDYGEDLILGGAGFDSLLGHDENDRLLGGDDNDTLDGGADHDILRGDAGNDSLMGSYGNDILFGGDGDDILYGEGTGRYYYLATDHDIMYGGAGNDTLVAGPGDDTMFGDAGIDTFRFNADTTGRNIIRDFEFGTDVLELDAGLWTAAGTLTAQEVADTYGVYSPNGANFWLSFDTVDIVIVGVSGLTTTDISNDFLIV